MSLSFDYNLLCQQFHLAQQSPHQYEQPLLSRLTEILESNLYDKLEGGVFSHGKLGRFKSLLINAQFVVLYSRVANVYSEASFAQAAIQTSRFFLSSNQSSFFDRYDYQDPDFHLFSIEELRHSLDSAQWAAIQCFFCLPEMGVIDTSRLQVHRARADIHLHTELHPKQVPLALDAALQLLAMIKQQRAQPAWGVEENDAASLQFCKALLTAGKYLNQPDIAQSGQQLLDILTAKPSLEVEPEYYLDVLLLSLQYQWRSSDFEQLQKLIDALKTKTQIKLQDSANHQDLYHLGRAFNFNTLERNFSEVPLLGSIIIEGPEFEARHWLQNADNQYQEKFRYYAYPIAGATETRAKLYSNDNAELVFDSLDSLINHCQDYA